MDSSNESEMKQSHSVLDSREEDLPSHPQTPPSGSEKQPSAITPPQKVPVHRNQEAGGETGGESRDDGTPSKQRHCKCKASRCLKLYCECFASGTYCNGCNCLNCHNTLEKETERQEAVKAILERNRDAFKLKIAGSPHGLMNDKQEDVSKLVTLGKHTRGCNCKRSGCLKRYCECYGANVRCSENCRCRDCKNFEGSKEIQLTTSASVKRYLHPPELRIRNSAPHSVAAARGCSSAFPHLFQNQTVDYVVRDGDTSLFTVPNNQAVSGSTTSTCRSSMSNTTQLRPGKELYSLLVSKSVDVANKMSEKETVAPERTSQEKEDKDRSSEVYAEQEKQILLCFRDHLYQLLNRLGGSIDGTNIQKDNTDPSRKEPEDEEQTHRD